jgi:Uma2 family endonuclease
MTALEKKRYTEEEYLALERESDTKHEFYGGEIFAMAGGSEAHALICHNLDVRLGMQILERPCRVYGSDMRLKVEATGLETYPDLSALCGPSEFTTVSRTTLLNPSLIVEVLSKSTQNYDKTEKFRQYRMIPSLLEYLMISQHEVYVEHYLRQSEGEWLARFYSKLEDTFTLESIACTLELGQVYWKVALEG